MSARHDEQIWLFERTVDFIRVEMAGMGLGHAQFPGRTWFFRRRRLLELKARLAQVQREMGRYMRHIK